MTTVSKTLVMEVKIGRTKCFLTEHYRSPAVENNTADGINCNIFKLQYPMENIDKQNSYLSIIIGDFNGKNTRWGQVNDKAGLLF